jgi:hypothetical protein
MKRKMLTNQKFNPKHKGRVLEREKPRVGYEFVKNFIHVGVVWT